LRKILGSNLKDDADFLGLKKFVLTMDLLKLSIVKNISFSDVSSIGFNSYIIS